MLSLIVCRRTKTSDLQRLISLSDCVFAVAMTLLAFSVRIPDQGVDPAKLHLELTRMWNEFSGLVLSFAIAAMFWVGHFRLLRSLSRATVDLIYLNLLQLFWIVVLPIFDEPLDPNRRKDGLPPRQGSVRRPA